MDFERFVSSFLRVADKLFRGKGLHVVLARFKLVVLLFFGGLSVGAFFRRCSPEYRGVGILGDGTFLYIITLTAGMAIFFVWIDYQFMTEWRKRVQPKQNRNDRRRPNQASEATSEHAPGAVSSARQG